MMTSAQRMAAKRALEELCATVEATGGCVETSKGIEPAGDRDWIDLASAYLIACEALGREPMIKGEDEDAMEGAAP